MPHLRLYHQLDSNLQIILAVCVSVCFTLFHFQCLISMHDHTRKRLERRFLRCTELWSSKNWCWYLMTHPKLLKVYGGTENVPKKKNSRIMFDLILDGCKIVFNLNLEKLSKPLTNILERPIQWKVCKNAVKILSNKIFLFIIMILMFHFLHNFPLLKK